MRHQAHFVLGIVILTLILSVVAIAGTIIRVPAQQPTIQAGIDAAVNGDTVLVSPGTYKENVNFNGKAITVKSAKGPALTLIDGQRLAPVVTLTTGETRKSILAGFTIQNGMGNYDGGGIYTNASPTIRGNVITLNTFCGSGGGIASEGGGPLIQNNVIHNNTQSGCSGGPGGGGVIIFGGAGAEIVGNVISDNYCWIGGGISVYGTTGLVTIQGNTINGNVGGGIYVAISTGATANVIQNLIVANEGNGIYWLNPPLLLVSNTIAGNAQGAFYGTASELAGGAMDNTVTMENNLVVATGNTNALSCTYYDPVNLAIFDHNDVFSAQMPAYGGSCPDLTGANGNLSVDPLFVALLSDDYHLQAASFVVDAGNNSAPDLLPTDFDGDARILNTTIDIGADEYSSVKTLGLSSYTLRYGTQEVGTSSAPQTVTLTNNGTTSITLKLIATGSDYLQTNTCGSSLTAGASCQINVSFSPVGGGARNGVLGIITNVSNPQSVTMNGTGLAPAVNLYPSYIYFSNQVVGTTGTQTATLTNTGLAPLSISSIAIAGSSDFIETNDCPTAPNTLAVNASCIVTVTWTPLIIASENATITVTDNANPTTQTIYASGTSYSAGVPTVSPGSLAFPDTLIGSSSAPQTVTLTNTGSGTLGNITFSPYGDYPVTNNNCPGSLAPTASCTFDVTFVPTFQGLEYGYLYIYNDSPSSGIVSSTGNGVAAVPTLLSLSPSSIAVGSVDTNVVITGSGFMYGSQVRLNGATLYGYYNSSTQFTVTVPAADLLLAGTAQITMFNPAPGGGTSNPLTLTIYTPVNYSSQSTTYDYRTIGGTNLNLSYYGSAAITSPFPIQFGGGSFTTLYVGAGGTISFSGYFYSEYNDIIPTTQTTTLVAPFWASLIPFGTGTNNNVFWQVKGTAPDRELIIEWKNVPYCCSNDSIHTVKFEVVFFEGSSNILFNYADTIFGGSYFSNDNGATATAGVQVASGLGTQFSYDTPSLKSNTALLWYPNQATVTLSTSTLDFGYHLIGTPSLPQKLTLTNGGLVALSISSITSDNSDFTQTNTCGSSVPPGGSCTITVKITPSQPNAEAATLTINDDAIGGPQTVSLSGIGATTPTVIFPIIMNFGGVAVGQSSTLPVTLANALNQPLTIQQITASPSVFTQTNTCGNSLAAGASCVVSVTFTPTQIGQVKGNLSFGLNGKPPVSKVRLGGSGQ